MARLVKEGGAVKGAIGQIEGRIANAYLWIIARQGKDIVGVAALKAPQQSYRDKLQRETGIELSEEKYPAELGYVAVSEACRGARLSSILMAELMSQPIGRDGVFVTTKRNGFCENALPYLGFIYRASYQNDDRETVHLLTKLTA